MSAVAKRWQITRARLSQVAADPMRPAHWDEALWGLPRAVAASRTDIERALRARAVLDACPARPALESASASAGARVHSAAGAKARVGQSDAHTPEWEIGDECVVRAEQGEHLPEGCRGVVQRLVIDGSGLRVDILFETGYREAFDARWLRSCESFLLATGR